MNKSPGLPNMPRKENSSILVREKLQLRDDAVFTTADQYSEESRRIKAGEHESQGDAILVRADPDLEDLIPGYLRNREEDVKTLTEALERGDYETIRILGHSMKGSGGGYGFAGITDTGRAIEQSAKDMSMEGIRRGIENLVKYLNRVKVVYE